MGTILVLMGAFVLNGFWLLGPETWRTKKELAQIAGLSEGRIERSWWRIDFRPEQLGNKGTNWGALTSPEFCVGIRYRNPTRGSTPAASCWRFHRLWNEWMLYEQALVSLYPDEEPVPWLDDTGGGMVEVRYSARAKEWLSGYRPLRWPLNPQPAGALEAAVQGNQIDLNWIAVDRPLDHMIRAWSRPGGPIRVAFHPEEPGRALPLAMHEEAIAPPREAFVPYFLAGFGLFILAFGWFRFFRAQTRLVAWLAVIISLATLPLWGGRLVGWVGSVVSPVALISAEVFATSPVVLFENVDEPAEEGELRQPWSLETSFYRDVLEGLELRRPPGAGSPDEVLRALLNSVSEQVLALPAEEQLQLFRRLRALNEADRTEVYYLFMQPAHQLALASDGEPGTVARNFLWSLPVRPVLASVPAYKTKLELWRSLVDFPDNPISNTAQAVVRQSG